VLGISRCGGIPAEPSLAAYLYPIDTLLFEISIHDYEKGVILPNVDILIKERMLIVIMLE